MREVYLPTVPRDAADGSRIDLPVGTVCCALVPPYSLDPEQDAMLFGSIKAAADWLRDALRAGGLYRMTTLRTDGTVDRCFWPCVDDDARWGFGLYYVRKVGDDPVTGEQWDGFNYVAGALTLGPRGGVRIER